MTVTVTPWPHWSPGAERIRATDATQLLIGPTQDHRAIEFAIGHPAHTSTRDPAVLRAFGDAFHRWADHLEAEHALPPIGQNELAL